MEETKEFKEWEKISYRKNRMTPCPSNHGQKKIRCENNVL